MLRITLLVQAFAVTTSFHAFVPPSTTNNCRRGASHTPPLFAAARKGAMSRKKGFAAASDESTRSTKKSEIKDGKIYSLPALYDLAFGYRNFEQEVDFLLYAHEEHAGFPATSVLELAAGPARHSVEALKLSGEEEGAAVQRVVALDMSPEMVAYGKELASHELADANTASFSYLEGDMRDFDLDGATFDTAWILLGSLQHMTTNANVMKCFSQIHNSLTAGGTLVIELPHPRETFSMVECTRNGWEVPLEDENGDAYGELAIVWGDEDDTFDPITQVRQFSVSMDLSTTDESMVLDGSMQSVKEVVPMRQFTAQEISALATCCGFEVAAMFGALDEEVSVNDDDEAFRLVCVLRKLPPADLDDDLNDDIDDEDDDQ
jgi:SAM-dependent methyltransferase